MGEATTPQLPPPARIICEDEVWAFVAIPVRKTWLMENIGFLAALANVTVAAPVPEKPGKVQ